MYLPVFPINNLEILVRDKSFSRPSMSQGTVMLHNNRFQEKDFTVATPEEFVKRFNGTKVINKVYFKSMIARKTCRKCLIFSLRC